MPTYEYECQSCDYKFEKSQNMSELPIKKCPKCQKDKVKRLIGAGSGIIFKGPGFYATDYRKDKSGKDNSKSKSCPLTKNGKPDCSSCQSH